MCVDVIVVFLFSTNPLDLLYHFNMKLQREVRTATDQRQAQKSNEGGRAERQ